MMMADGKTVRGYKNITYIEPQMSKNLFDSTVHTISNGALPYYDRKYPPMKQYWWGKTNHKTYDIDFNNFFLRAYLEYFESNNIKHEKTTRQLKLILKKLNENREIDKNRLILFYNQNREIKTVAPPVIDYYGYGVNCLTQTRLRQILDKITGHEHIKEEHIEEIVDNTCEYAGYFTVINKYHYYKYFYLAGIGWLKRKNEQLWWNIMKHATTKMEKMMEFCNSEGVTVYNTYIDSVQCDTNLIKKYPELFDYYPAKMDKEGSTYGICLPPSYWINSHRARWLNIDYFKWFNRGYEEEIDLFNSKLIHLRDFTRKRNHPLSNHIELDTKNRTLITHKIDKLEPLEWNFDFVPEKTECRKAEFHETLNKKLRH